MLIELPRRSVLKGLGALSFFGNVALKTELVKAQGSERKNLISPSLELENLQQKSYYEDFVKARPEKYGTKLYTREELSDPNFKPEKVRMDSGLRIGQYFLKFGLFETIKYVENNKWLGVEVKYFNPSKDKVFQTLFGLAGVKLNNDSVPYFIFKQEGLFGSDSHLFNLPTIERYGHEDQFVCVVKDANISTSSSLGPRNSYFNFLKLFNIRYDETSIIDGAISNEVFHYLVKTYFPFLAKKGLTVQISGYEVVPKIKAIKNIQIEQFLSHVFDAANGGNVSFLGLLENDFPYFSGLLTEYHKTKEKYFSDPYYICYEVFGYLIKRRLSQKRIKSVDSYFVDLVKARQRNTYDDLDKDFVRLIKIFNKDDIEWMRKEFIKIGMLVLKRLST